MSSTNLEVRGRSLDFRHLGMGFCMECLCGQMRPGRVEAGLVRRHTVAAWHARTQGPVCPLQSPTRHPALLLLLQLAPWARLGRCGFFGSTGEGSWRVGPPRGPTAPCHAVTAPGARHKPSIAIDCGIARCRTAPHILLQANLATPCTAFAKGCSVGGPLSTSCCRWAYRKPVAGSAYSNDTGQ